MNKIKLKVYGALCNIANMNLVSVNLYKILILIETL